MVFDNDTRDRLRMLMSRNTACWQLATEDELIHSDAGAHGRAMESSRELWRFFNGLPWVGADGLVRVIVSPDAEG